MEILTSVLIFIIGSMLGSFYACMGYRIPNKISTLYPRSYCEHCKKTLKWYMNIPIFSYIFLKGKCAYCKSKIPVSSLLIELFTGTNFLISYLYFGFTKEFFITIILLSVLSITFISDFKYLYISDRVIVISLIAELIVYLKYLSFNEITKYLIAMVVMFLLLYLLKIVADKILKKESLGGGDIKLMLLVGFTLGFINSLVSLFISSVLALVFTLISKSKKNILIPFGPFIIIGIIITYILIYNGFNFYY